MLKKTVLLVLLLVALTAGAGGLYVWSATQGEAASSLEAEYMTAADRFVDVAGARVRVREEGPKDAEPIILIHGFTFSLESFDAWAEALKKDYRVIRFDLLGHGLSGPDPKERYSPEERAAFIGDLMDAIDIESAVIAGNSLGGLAAWRFASTDPDRVDALILISPGVYPNNGVGDTPVPIPPAMRVYLMTAPEAGVRASAALVYADDAKVTEARIKTLRDMIRREGNGEAMLKSLEEFTLPDPTTALTNIAAPTLILWGEGDILIPVEQGRRMVEDMPDATLITYPGVGHAAQEEAPDATVADAVAFMKTQGAAQ